MITNFKEKPWRSKRYLAWIRTHDCVDCDWPASLGNIDAHHIETGGTSTKCGDQLTVPLCSPDARGCHRAADKSPTSADKYRPTTEALQQEWLQAGNRAEWE